MKSLWTQPVNPTTWGWCGSTLSKFEASMSDRAEQYLKGSRKFPRIQQQTSADRWELFDEYEEQVVWFQVRGKKIIATVKGLKDTWTACSLRTWEKSETGTRGTAIQTNMLVCHLWWRRGPLSHWTTALPLSYSLHFVFLTPNLRNEIDRIIQEALWTTWKDEVTDLVRKQRTWIPLFSQTIGSSKQTLRSSERKPPALQWNPSAGREAIGKAVLSSIPGHTKAKCLSEGKNEQIQQLVVCTSA